MFSHRTKSPLGLLWPVLLLAGPVAARAADPGPFLIVVEAGAFDRRDVIVSVLLPAEVRSAKALRRKNEIIPLQVEGDGQATFKLKEMAQGSSATYELVKAEDLAPEPTGALRGARQGTKLQFAYSAPGPNPGRALPLLEYQAEAGELPRADIKPIFKRGGYLHPIQTLQGQVVTDDYAPNHVHHHGVWWAWTKTRFSGREPDFWNMGEGKGRVEFVGVDSTWDGLVQAGFRARHRFVDLTATEPVAVLEETWKVNVFGPVSRTAWIFDLESEQICLSQPLVLPEYHYGGLGFRGNRAWDGKDRTYFLTSAGETDRVKAHATRARWCDVSGDVEGQRVGIAILGHPTNFRAPQPMRVHPTEPFFCFAPQQAGEMTLQPGAVYRSRYRFLVHDGPPDRAELERCWNDFASPPMVRVTRAP